MTARVLLMALLAGCGSGELPPSPPPPLEGERIVISRLGVSMRVPAGYAVYSRGDRPDSAWVVDMNPGGRQPRRIVLAPAGEDSLGSPGQGDPACPWTGPHEAVMSQNSAISYHSSVGCGGSGGVEARLVGTWTIDARRFAVSCTAQGEPAPVPAGCLEQLRSARAVPITDTPPRLGPTGTTQPPLLVAPPGVGAQSSGEPG